MATGFIASIMSHVENEIIRDIVFKSYTTLVSDYRFTIGLMITLLIVLVGFKLMYSDGRFTVGDGVRRLTVALVIWILLTNWDLFALFFVDTLTEGPNALAASLTKALTGKEVDSYAGLGDLYDDASAVSSHILSKVGLSMQGLGFLFFGLLYVLIAFGAILLALGFILIAKLGLAVLLIIAPVPIAFAMYGPTTGLFVGWLRSLIGLAFLPVMIVAALVFMLSIVGTTVDDAATGKVELTLEVLFGQMFLMGVGAFLFWHIMDIAKSIGGGLNISGRDINVFIKRVSTLGMSR